MTGVFVLVFGLHQSYCTVESYFNNTFDRCPPDVMTGGKYPWAGSPSLGWMLNGSGNSFVAHCICKSSDNWALLFDYDFIMWSFELLYEDLPEFDDILIMSKKIRWATSLGHRLRAIAFMLLTLSYMSCFFSTRHKTMRQCCSVMNL